MNYGPVPPSAVKSLAHTASPDRCSPTDLRAQWRWRFILGDTSQQSAGDGGDAVGVEEVEAAAVLAPVGVARTIAGVDAGRVRIGAAHGEGVRGGQGR